jgi:hypothetical protein
MNRIIQHALPSIENLRVALKTHGTAWPADNGCGYFDFDRFHYIQAMIDSQSYFAGASYTAEQKYTIAAFTAYAAFEVDHPCVINDELGVEEVTAAMDALTAVLPDQRIFVMSEELAELAIYGGDWGGESIEGWRGIEELDVEAAEAALGQTVVVLVGDSVRHIRSDFAEAVDATEGEQSDDDEVVREFGLLPPGFWNAKRHARLLSRG